MGGYGSGVPLGAVRKTCVEDCLALNVGQLRRDGALPPGGTLVPSAGSVHWRSTRTGEITNSVGYRLTPVGDTMTLTLSYFTRGESVDLSIRLQIKS